MNTNNTIIEEIEKDVMQIKLYNLVDTAVCPTMLGQDLMDLFKGLITDEATLLERLKVEPCAEAKDIFVSMMSDLPMTGVEETLLTTTKEEFLGETFEAMSYIREQLIKQLEGNEDDGYITTKEEFDDEWESCRAHERPEE